MSEVTESSKPRFVRAFRSLGDRRMAAMLLLSFAAGIPYGAVIGALNAWLTEEGIRNNEIGILSFIILAYSFKFIWSPAFHKPQDLFPSKLGARRSWLLGLQLLIAALIGVISFTRPDQAIGIVALSAFAIAISSATHDIVLDAWRIEVAETDEDLDLMSAIYQFGYRLAGLLTGALALVLAARIGWASTYLVLAGCMALSIIGTLIAPTPKDQLKASLNSLAENSGIHETVRHWTVAAVSLSWAVGIFLILQFMYLTFTFVPIPDDQVLGYLTPQKPSGRSFIRETGPWIVALTVIFPVLIATGLNHQKRVAKTARRASNAVFGSIVLPLMDLSKRLGWGVILVLLLILTYRFADLVWGSFAFPFYLGVNSGALGRSLDEIALASKTFGVLMTILGSGLGAIALIWLGRMPCLIIGAFFAAVTNLLFADLAAGRFDMETGATITSAGGANVSAFLNATGLASILERLPPLFGLESSPGLTNLMGAIAGENLAVGFASVASVAYLTSIVNPKYAAVQYALLASLTMLIGSLGRAPLGAMIDSQGFYPVFILTFWIGLVPVGLAILETIRQRRSPMTTGE